MKHYKSNTLNDGLPLYEGAESAQPYYTTAIYLKSQNIIIFYCQDCRSCIGSEIFLLAESQKIPV